jgi:phosphatidylserine decarboxylase
MKALGEAKWIFAIELAVLLVVAKFTIVGMVIALALLLFTFYFFRDPDPVIPPGTDLIVSPASGKVDVIEEADEPIFRAALSRRVSIFLSVFDIHTQRAPIAGTVKLIKATRGKFANALRPSCADANENQVIGLEGEGMRVTVRQVAGFLARRICTWCKEGDVLAKGGHLGMIRFGSRVDIYLPAELEIAVKLGDQVRGGETILARRK